MITLAQAKANVGRFVAYQSHHNSPPEYGEIQRVGEVWVYVRYAETDTVKATAPEDLTLTVPSDGR